MQPRASKCLTSWWGNSNLNDAWSFTFVNPPHASKAAASPLGVKPFKCKIVMFCRQLMLASDNSPTSVTELWDKLICKEKEWIRFCGLSCMQSSKKRRGQLTCLRFWEKWASGSIPASSMLWHFFMSSLVSSLHPTAMAVSPKDVISEQPRLSSVFNREHFDKDSNERSIPIDQTQT